uniref:MARVEL domain-containing protein n=1 Tax=Plectus sambesii TaxID=2011161 RepID=A0A914V454_9BILA
MSGVVQLNVGFFVERQGFLKIAQFVLGLVVTIIIGACNPHTGHYDCGHGVQNFFQGFVLICINIFTLIITFLLIVAHLLNLPDAYYKWNFPIFERLYTTLATLLYILGTVIVIIYMFANGFQGAWIIAILLSIFITAAYALDAYMRWKYRNIA